MPDSKHSVADLLASATARLKPSDDALPDAQLLLAWVLQKGRSFLYAYPEFQPDDRQRAEFARLVERRAAGEPIAYLTGQREFWSLSLQVNPATLIPRHETETLVEQCLARIPVDADWSIADLGTGSGAIALALASERPGCHVTATDRSPSALQTATDNASRLGLDNIAFFAGDWFGALPARQIGHFQLIASNPPYIADHDPHLQQGDVVHEPRSALASGRDGLDDIRTLIAGAAHYLLPGGWLLLEHGYDQADKIVDLLQATGYDAVSDYRDLAGQPRIAAGRRRD